jgi:hypothetical protein
LAWRVSVIPPVPCAASSCLPRPSSIPPPNPGTALIARDAEAPLRRSYLPDVLRRLSQEAPDHPLLGVFLPYLENDDSLSVFFTLKRFLIARTK